MGAAFQAFRPWVPRLALKTYVLITQQIVRLRPGESMQVHSGQTHILSAKFSEESAHMLLAL